MKRFLKGKTFLFVSSCLMFSMLNAAIRSADSKSTPSSESVNQADTASPGSDATSTAATSAADDTVPSEAMQPAKSASHLSAATGEAVDQSNRADAFIAGPDWEFDGFVSGGQDSKVRSMFYLNDLLYLNIGSKQGIASGEKLEVYKRGDKIYDPQTGRFIGYEVRRAAVVRATDHVEDDTSAVRIIRTHEPVEIGDLVRRIQ